MALYFVGRGIAELFLVSYSRPASYRDDWGGPSLIGVLAVHSGPGLIVVGAVLVTLRRRFTRTRESAAGL